MSMDKESLCSSMTSGIGQSDQSIQSNDRPTSLENITARVNDQNDITPSTSSSSPPSTGSSSVSATVQKTDLDGVDPELKSELKRFVDIIFTDSQSISREKKAEFGQLVRSPEARLLFAVFVDDYRVNSKRVSELTFYSLAQYFSIVLFECLYAEDFRPAKIIMNMMFTYYYEQNYNKLSNRDKQLVSRRSLSVDSDVDADSFTDDGAQMRTVKTYLYTLLKDQEIFKSIRFWTSAFYESVIIERNKHSVFVDRKPNKHNNEEEVDCSKNISFGLLGSFIHNMCLLGLSPEFCKEFLDKHSTIAGLSEDQLEMLKSNLFEGR